MARPLLHVIAGPNGAGKTTFFDRVLGPATGLPFINADRIAARHWPEDPTAHAYEAARRAADLRAACLEQRRSFATETVFSHPSKVQLLDQARRLGYRVHLHGILVPEELAVQRVRVRVETGGHAVPIDKVRERFRRLWALVREGISIAHRADLRDNSRAARPFRLVASCWDGRALWAPSWPSWVPDDLR